MSWAWPFFLARPQSQWFSLWPFIFNETTTSDWGSRWLFESAKENETGRPWDRARLHLQEVYSLPRHGKRTAASSHELQNFLSHELQNGPCRRTFELEYPEIFIQIWFSSGIIVALRLQYQYGNTSVNCLIGMDKSFINSQPYYYCKFYNYWRGEINNSRLHRHSK